MCNVAILNQLDSLRWVAGTRCREYLVHQFLTKVIEVGVKSLDVHLIVILRSRLKFLPVVEFVFQS